MVAQRALRIVRREAALVPSPGALAQDAVAPAESRVRRFVASNEAVDRYNTIIRASGWQLENFTRNPVILFGHNGRDLPIGKGTPSIVGTSLMLDVEFLSAEENPLAEQAMRILDKGLMGVSVGFDPIAEEYDASRETGDEFQDFFFPPINYTAADLLEVSVVTIPANPEALPVGRGIQQRALERAIARRAPKPELKRGPSSEEIRALIERVTKEEVAALAARKSGVTTSRR